MPEHHLTGPEAQQMLQFKTIQPFCPACTFAVNLPDEKWPYPVCLFHLGGKHTEAEIIHGS